MNLNQVTIPVSDMEVSISFYRKLGLQLIVDSRPRYACFVCPDGSSTFSLHQADAVSGGVWIYFECSTLDETVAQLAGAGITFESMPEDQPLVMAGGPAPGSGWTSADPLLCGRKPVGSTVAGCSRSNGRRKTFVK